MDGLRILNPIIARHAFGMMCTGSSHNCTICGGLTHAIAYSKEGDTLNGEGEL